MQSRYRAGPKVTNSERPQALYSIEASVILPSRQGSEAHSTEADLFTLDDLRVCILMSATLVSLDAN
jgi:hypothetical protein